MTAKHERQARSIADRFAALAEEGVISLHEAERACSSVHEYISDKTTPEEKRAAEERNTIFSAATALLRCRELEERP